MTFLFLNLGAGEIFVIALFVLMFFGSKQIPDIMRGLGKATRQFRDAMNGIEHEVRSATNISSSDEETKKVHSVPEGTQTTQGNAQNAKGIASDGPVKTEDPPVSNE